MVIANPIYDVVFKRMMENERVAKFFIGTLLDETIETVEVKPQEFTFIKDLNVDDPAVEKYVKEKLQQRLSINVFRLDFIATIKTKTGEYKKVLIEIQKAKNQMDLMRFRSYLGEQYKKEETIDGEKTALPITAIYILGFNLPEIPTPCLKVERNYRDLVESKAIITKSDFVEKLTHDSFIIQVERILDKYQTKLDKLLSIFEQKNFVDDRKIVKEFKHEIDNEDIKLATDILHHTGTDPEERRKIETEQEAWRTINAMFEDREKQLLQALEQKNKALTEKDNILIEKDNILIEKDQALKEKDQLIEELLRKLNEKNN